MAYVLYHKNNPAISIKYYRTAKGAQIAMTRFNKNAYFECKELPYAFMVEHEWNRLYRDKMVKTTNLLTGKEVLIPVQDKGGPCDPGTERYWSM